MKTYLGVRYYRRVKHVEITFAVFQRYIVCLINGCLGFAALVTVHFTKRTICAIQNSIYEGFSEK